MATLARDYPWTRAPLIVSAPMRPFATHELALAVSYAGGLGFIPNNNDVRATVKQLELFLEKGNAEEFTPLLDALWVGVGFQVYEESLAEAMALVDVFPPVAVWLFAARNNEEYRVWTEGFRSKKSRVVLPGTNKGPTVPKVWIQVGTVQDALEVAGICHPDVLVVQGTDAGGHGLARSASLITLLPEVMDALEDAGFGHIPVLAAGGIVDGRGAAAALALGASGVVMGTRFLAAEEAAVPQGFREHLLSAWDGGVQTVRTRLFDELRGTGEFPAGYDGRALVNRSVLEERGGLKHEENEERYQAARNDPGNGYGKKGRLVSYAGSGVGMINKVMSAAEIMKEVRQGTESSLRHAGRTLEAEQDRAR